MGGWHGLPRCLRLAMGPHMATGEAHNASPEAMPPKTEALRPGCEMPGEREAYGFPPGVAIDFADRAGRHDGRRANGKGSRR